MAICPSNLHCGGEQPLRVGTARTRTNKASAELRETALLRHKQTILTVATKHAYSGSIVIKIIIMILHTLIPAFCKKEPVWGTVWGAAGNFRA